MELLRIHVVLDGVAPTVWRRLDVPRSMTLDRLHLVLQGAMGWTDAHVHEFETVARDGSRHPQRYLPDDALDDGEPGEREATMPVGRLLGRPGDLLRYLYDAGDAWTHTLRLEQVVPALDAGPRCLGGGRACPPEGCGGPTGYDRLLRVLAGERRRDAERFDVARAQAAIARLLQEHPVRATVGPVGDPTSRPGVPEEPQGGSRPGASDPSGPVDAMLLRATGHGAESLAELVRRARLSERVEVDVATAERAVAPVAWFVRRVGVEGVPLTAAGYLRPVDVAAVAHRLDLAEEWQGTLTREVSTVPVLVWREALQRVGVLRVAKGRLHATRAAVALADDPVGLWCFLADRLPVGTGAERDAGMVMLLELAGDDAAALDDTPAAPGLAAVGATRTGTAMHALGWCARDGGMLTVAEIRATAERTVELLLRLGAYVDAGVLGRRVVPTPDGVLFARAALQTWR